MRSIFFLIVALLPAACNSRSKYDINEYFDLRKQDEIMTRVVTYIMDAPPMTAMADRFKAEHYNHYSFLTSKFAWEKFYIDSEGIHYFYIIRPTANPNEKRGVGGHFRMDKNFNINSFREEFVTPALPIEDVKGRCAFLFEEMVNGKLENYLKMPTYVQWPNEASYYDTVTYEWKLKPEFESN